MASEGSAGNIKSTINGVNDADAFDNEFYDKECSYVCQPGEDCTMYQFGAGPEDPEDIQQVFHKLINTEEGVHNTLMKMVETLYEDGCVDLANEIAHKTLEGCQLPKVVTSSGIVEEYADAGRTKDSLYVFKIFSDWDDSRPSFYSADHCNIYTYSVIIKALVADPDPNFLEVAKECVMKMMSKGMQPIARSYTAVYEAFCQQGKIEEGKQFLGEMKAKGFVADNKAMMAMNRVLKGKGAVIKSVVEILFSDLEDYSDDSDADEEVQNYSKVIELMFPEEISLSVSKNNVMPDDDPEFLKDLPEVMSVKRKNWPVMSMLAKMIIMLRRDKFFCQAEEVMSELESTKKVPDVVTHTCAMGLYAKAGKVKKVMKVYTRMLSCGVAPNAYTYSVLIRALAKDPNFLDDLKMYTLEMMDKGMRPNAKTYTTVFKAFAQLKDFKVEKGKEFLKEMKAKGFVPNKKAVMEVLKGRKGPVVKTVTNILFTKK